MFRAVQKPSFVVLNRGTLSNICRLYSKMLPQGSSLALDFGKHSVVLFERRSDLQGSGIRRIMPMKFSATRRQLRRGQCFSHSTLLETFHT
jgi:hypothetical protein